MKFATVERNGEREWALIEGEAAYPAGLINEKLGTAYPTDLLGFIEADALGSLRNAIDGYGGINEISDGLPLNSVQLRTPIEAPRRVLGIGLNYREHAGDLDESSPEEPATFLKPATSLIGSGDAIRLPRVSDRVTAEGELCLVVGKRCRNLEEVDGLDSLFGVTAVIDMTAEDILRRNPRFLTRAKGFDTFISVGPWIVTMDELPSLEEIEVSTVINGEVVASNHVRNMTNPPKRLLHILSQQATFLSGDLISTGTPRAGVIRPGDVAEARVRGVGRLANPVEAG